MTQTTRRGRPKRRESYAEWMARIDASVEYSTSKVTTDLPLKRLLTPIQRRILEMLAEYMRSLEPPKPGESVFKNEKYIHMNIIISRLFRDKYPEWKPDKDGVYNVDQIPNNEGTLFSKLLRGCGGHPPDQDPDEWVDDD